MPFPPPSRTPLGTSPGPRRRTLLASAAGAALLVGCTAEPDSTVTSAGSPSVAERTRARAARDSTDLVQQYDAAIAAFPVLAERLAELRAEAERHAKAFGGGEPTPTPTPTPAPTSTPTSTSTSASPSAPTGPADEQDALAGLVAAERTLVDRRTKALLDVPGELARVLASVAAAGAAHVYLLTEGMK
ncbi:hypothetical protein ACOT81_34770 [Streptomyces sp. WI04-05B]|uniref:hypothetical protein n=1 Tax=Streptomyces TaxID=1883 RepID=UPI0029BD2DFF|nr:MULTISPECIES: hypothetical protein [unclassified Streptomyces]MDX2542028.1 hypothetical protein [Streptomyces sp. WI04-05B]MDX2587110.1 hypothetical protein [Streptomyces sp. WI04-05A]